MANQRGIVSGWDASKQVPKGVTAAADMRASLGAIATHEGMFYDPVWKPVRASTSMTLTIPAFTMAVKSSLGGWLCPTIGQTTITLPTGHASYGRYATFWVRQWDYETNADHPDSEVETGLAQGTAASVPQKPSVPVGAVPAFHVLIPKGATSASDIPAENITPASWVTPVGGVIQGVGGQPLYWSPENGQWEAPDPNIIIITGTAYEREGSVEVSTTGGTWTQVISGQTTLWWTQVTVPIPYAPPAGWHFRITPIYPGGAGQTSFGGNTVELLGRSRPNAVKCEWALVHD